MIITTMDQATVKTSYSLSLRAVMKQYLIAFNILVFPFVLVSMEVKQEPQQETKKVTRKVYFKSGYLFTEIQWPHQICKTINIIDLKAEASLEPDKKVESSISYCIPIASTEQTGTSVPKPANCTPIASTASACTSAPEPFIGHAQCICSQIEGLSNNIHHKNAILAMLYHILAEFKGAGFHKFSCAKRIYESPSCLAALVPQHLKIEKEGKVKHLIALK